jgi:2,3-bisphosphoglycerate-independent phosphoglycerate mutase
MKPVVLVVLDGWGYREEEEHNAIAEAHTPFWDEMWQKYPHSLLSASGEALGLPPGQIGSSEIGHMTIGLGKIMDNDLVRINKAIARGELDRNKVMQGLFNHVKSNNSVLHFIGKVSPGGVHSHQKHLHELIKAAKKAGIKNIAIHAFSDGRDTPPQSSVEFFRDLEDVIETEGVGVIATLGGRYYGMDRDTNWDRTAKVEDAIFLSKGHISKSKKPSEYIEELHKQGMLDEFLEPVVFLGNTDTGVSVQANDGILFFNFRADRTRQLSQRIIERTRGKNVFFATMTQYDPSFQASVVFPPEPIETVLASEISKAGLTQVHIAETEKYAHATYFLNGGREAPHAGETHVLIDTRKDIFNHDEAPEMRAREITNKALECIEHGKTDFIFINYANADVVGHTANAEAVKMAIKTIDGELSRLVPAVIKSGGVVVITADHGNAETNVDTATGNKHSAHTTSDVPFIVTLEHEKLANKGTLADVAPTVLHLLGLPHPAAMTGKNLLS